MNMRIRIVLFLVLCLHPLSSPAQSFGGPIRFTLRPNPTNAHGTNANWVLEWNAVPRVNYYLYAKLAPNASSWIGASYPLSVPTNSTYRFPVTIPYPGRPYCLYSVQAGPMTEGGAQIGPLAPTNLAIWPVDRWGYATTNAIPPATNSPPATNAPPVATNTPPNPRVRIAQSLDPIVDDQTSGSFGGIVEFFESDSPKYHSTRVETNRWQGEIVVPAGQASELYVRSDDGARVTVNGVVQHDTFGLGQNWDVPERSFHFVCCLSGGSSNWLVVDYSNTIHTGSGDNDGITIFVVGDNPDHPRLLGDTQLDWYGTETAMEFEYTLNAHARPPVTWRVSSRLQVVSTNETLQRLTVKPTGYSTGIGDDWIEAVWTPRCGSGSVTSRLGLTILVPVKLQNMTRTVTLGTYVMVTYSYRLLDQFARPYPFTCYVSEQTYARSGSPPPGTWIAPDGQNILVPAGGMFVDRLGYQRFGGTFTRNQIIHAHRNRDGFGIACRLNILSFEGDDIVATLYQP